MDSRAAEQNGGQRRRAYRRLQPHAVPPSVAADRERVAAMIVRAIDQDATHAHVAHLGEGDFLRAALSGHGPMIPPKWSRVKPLLAG